MIHAQDVHVFSLQQTTVKLKADIERMKLEHELEMTETRHNAGERMTETRHNAGERMTETRASQRS